MCKEAKILLAMSVLFTFTMGLSSIFVNVFFWKQTSNFIIIVVYNLLQYIITPITFLIAGMLAKKKNGIWSLRIGLFLFAMFYGLILFVGSRGVPYIYFLGMLYGTAVGFYWLAFNTLAFDFTCLNNRDTFNGFNGSLCGVAAAVAPVTSGYVISRFNGIRGYNVVFMATLSIFILLIIISMLLRCKNYGSRIDFNKAYSRNNDWWGIIRKSTMLWGFRDVIIVFLVNILIIETTKSEFSLGKLSLMGSLLSSISYMLVQRIIKPPKRRLSILIGSIFSFIAIWGIAYKVTYGTLLFYVLVDAFFLPFFMIQLSSSTFNVISREHEENMRIEYMINKDISLNIGRITSSIILLILLLTFNDLSALKAYLVFIGLGPVLSGVFLRRLRRVLEGV